MATGKRIAVVCTGAVGGYAGAHMVQAGEGAREIPSGGDASKAASRPRYPPPATHPALRRKAVMPRRRDRLGGHGFPRGAGSY